MTSDPKDAANHYLRMSVDTAIERAIDCEQRALQAKARLDERDYLAWKRMEARWLAKAEELQ